MLEFEGYPPGAKHPIGRQAQHDPQKGRTETTDGHAGGRDKKGNHRGLDIGSFIGKNPQVGHNRPYQGKAGQGRRNGLEHQGDRAGKAAADQIQNAIGDTGDIATVGIDMGVLTGAKRSRNGSQDNMRRGYALNTKLLTGPRIEIFALRKRFG